MLLRYLVLVRLLIFLIIFPLDTIKKQIGSALSNHSNLNPKEYNDHTFKKYVSKTVPSTKYGGSDAFLSASAGLELRYGTNSCGGE